LFSERIRQWILEICVDTTIVICINTNPGNRLPEELRALSGGEYGSISTYGSTSGTFYTQFVPQEVGRYLRVAHYLVNINKPR
jgi:hypothetical protein